VDHLKNFSQIEHSRHRSPTNFLTDLVSRLLAYCHQPKKPSLGLLSGTLHRHSVAQTEALPLVMRGTSDDLTLRHHGWWEGLCTRVWLHARLPSVDTRPA